MQIPRGITTNFETLGKDAFQHWNVSVGAKHQTAGTEVGVGGCSVPKGRETRQCRILLTCTLNQYQEQMCCSPYPSHSIANIAAVKDKLVLHLSCFSHEAL